MAELTDRHYPEVVVGVLVGLLGVLIPAFIAGDLLSVGVVVLGFILTGVAVHLRQPYGIDLGVVVIVLAGFAFWSPYWHGLFYGLTFVQPGMLQWLVVGSLLAFAGVLLHDRKEGLAFGLFIVGGAIAILGFLIVGWVAGGIYAQVDMSEQVESEVIELNGTESLAHVDAENPRALPQAVAKQYAQNSLQSPRYELAGGDITFIEETPYWSYAWSPDGLYNTFTQKQRGGVFVRMTTQNKDVQLIEDEFTYGQGQLIFDDVNWQLKKHQYLHDYRDPFVVAHQDRMYLAVPYVDYNVKFRITPIPQLYSVPEFGGVAVVDQDGNVEYLSPQEAQEDPRLAGQNIRPYSHDRYRVNSMRYKHGAINKWFVHEDQLQLANVPGQGNDQPFTVVTEQGIKYYLAAEPWGEDTHGVYQVWQIDARSGEMERATFPVEESLFGPERATRLVRQEHPNYQWASGSGDEQSGTIALSEPIPVAVSGTLYWQTFVVPTDSAGVAQVSFVNAHTGEVTSVETDEGIRAFLQGQAVESVDGAQDDSQRDGETVLVIQVSYPDGSTERINVTEGTSITIEATNSTG